MSVKLEPHNQTGYEATKKIFENGNRAAVISPTGTGKSYIGLKLIEDNYGKKVIYLAPSKAILHQFKKNMIENGVKFNDGKNKLVGRYTYQKLTRMLKSGELNLDADIIILDEFHHCGAPEWGEAVKELLEQNPEAKVLGLSATPMRYFDEEIRDMAEELFDNNIASEMSFGEAIEQGVLPEPIYTTGIYEVNEIVKEYEEKIEKCDDEEKRKVARASLKELKDALSNCVEGLPELLENNMTNKSGKYIVFCKNIEDMQEKMSNAQKMFGKVNSEIELYSVSSKKYDDAGNIVDVNDVENNRQINKFEKNNDEKLKLLFSIDMLNEGWHYSGIDGVIMMRPTSSPTLFAQQLGRGLSIGENKRPIIIDLVNNADSIKIIENFYREFGETKGKESKSILKGITVSENTRNVSEIMNKLDKLLNRRVSLSNEEKLKLMQEYIESIKGTDEKFTSDSIYKGYNVGSMRQNLRASYWNGTLKIDEELLEKFKESGIIIEEPERKRISLQKQYEFLIEASRKSGKELEKIEDETGLKYSKVRNYIQIAYNKGQLKLEPEQIEKLKQNGILYLSKQELEKTQNPYGFPEIALKKIIKNFGSVENFIDKYKKGECENNYSGVKIEGARAITISKKDMTVIQKKNYVSLVRDLLRQVCILCI